jgi:hypothetical protein
MTAMLLTLQADWIQCLLEKAGKKSLAYEVLSNVDDLPSVPRVKHFIRCNELAAADILELAQAHCPDAVAAIESALLHFRASVLSSR